MRNGLGFSEAGRLGGIVSSKIQKEQKEQRIARYNLYPKCCKFCKNPLAYEKRRNNFCNHHCAASECNKGVVRNFVNGRYGKKSCLECCKETDNSFFCCQKCSKIYKWKQKKKSFEETGKWEGCNSENVSRRLYKRYLLEMRGHRCEMCMNEKWLDGPIPLILDHIDGNSDNGLLTNLRLVCGNCDMLLPTYKSKNIGRGRAYRRKLLSLTI